MRHLTVRFWLVAVCMVVPRILAAQYDFSRLIDLGETVPGGAGRLTGFAAPALDGRDLVFFGGTDTGVTGYFLYDGENDTLTAAAPTGVVTEGGFPLVEYSPQPSFYDGQFTGWARDANRGEHIVIGDGESLTDVVYTRTSNPLAGGGTISFESFGRNPAIHGGTVAFKGIAIGGDEGIYGRADGEPLHVFANRDVRVAETENRVISFDDPSFDGVRVAYRGVDDDGHAGLFFNSSPTNGGIVASTAPFFDVRPESGERYLQFSYRSVTGQPQMEDELVYATGEKIEWEFEAGELTRSVNPGVYAHRRLFDPAVHERLQLTVDRAAAVSMTSADGGVSAFLAQESGLNALYASEYLPQSGIFRPSSVMREGQLLDGKVVRSLSIQPDAVSGRRIAFAAQFDDRTSAIYLAEPSSRGALPAPHTNASADVLYGNPAFPATDAPNGQSGEDEVSHPEFSDSFVLRGPVPLDFDESFAHGSGYVLGRDGQGTPTVHALARAQGSYFGGARTEGGGIRAAAVGQAISVWEPHVSQTTGGELIDVDLDVTLHGLLDVTVAGGGGDGNDPQFLFSLASVELVLHQESTGEVFEKYRSLRLDANGELSGALADLGVTQIVSQYENGVAYELDTVLHFEDVAFISPGEDDKFAIDFRLDALAYVFEPGGERLGAFADFLNSSGFTLASDTPGVTFVQVPEPASILLALFATVALIVHRRIRTWIALTRSVQTHIKAGGTFAGFTSSGSSGSRPNRLASK